MDLFLHQDDADRLFEGAGSPAPALRLVPRAEPFTLAGPPPLPAALFAPLRDVRETLPAAIETVLSTLLGPPVTVVGEDAERVPAHALVPALGTPCAAFALDCAGADAAGATRGAGLLAFDLGLALHLVDRLLGGPGERLTAPRPLTELEQTIVADVARRLIAPAGRTLGDALGVRLGLGAFESDPARLPALAADAPLLVFALRVGEVDPPEYVTLAVPLACLPDGARSEAAGRRPADAGHPRPARPEVASALRASTLNVRVRLPQFRITARAALGLVPGQVLDTNLDAESLLEVLVEDVLRYRASAGRMRRRLGARVEEVLSPGASDAPAHLREGRIL